MGEGVEVLGYVSHNRSLVWSDIADVLNIEKGLLSDGFNRGKYSNINFFCCLECQFKVSTVVVPL